EADPAFAAVWLLGVAAAVAATLAYRRRLIALLLVGAVGLAVSLAFVYLSAPDLALTQLLVEMVTVILMMLALHWLPSESAPEGARGRAVRDALFALAAGAGIAALAYAAMTREPRSIAQFFLDRAVPEGGGGNVVNVILVDFRGYDTLGEITVLGIAGLIIHALLAGYTAQARHAGPVDYAAGRSLLLQLASRLLLPLAILLSLYLFLRGHNQPGGGFIAGLVLALALVLLYVAHGQQWVDARLRTDWRVWIAAGLLAAAGCGAASLLFGAPFLTSTYVYLPLPIIGAVPLASALVFDLGVYLTVAGATMAALVSIGRIRREPR
ncbi:MAG: DUF4040 domain-containing protein, partial [Burkholderiaceae bacterium]|nr:DUF4040 domain-containing protein [Burkholderiaceae bacterium]